MPSLESLQRAFAAELRREGLSKLGHGIVDDEIPAQRRLNVYRNNVKANLRSALQATYPVLGKLLGPEYFHYLADAYAKAHPSQSGDLRNFGRDLPDFLIDVESVKTLPYISDVARLDWACSVVSEAAPTVSRDQTNIDGLAPVDIAKLRFRARDASRLVRSSFPIFSIWSANQEDYIGDESVSLDEGPQSVLVVRPNLELELWLLDEAGSLFAEALLAGNSLAEAVDVVTTRVHDVDLNALFAKYLRSGAPLLSMPGGQSSCETGCGQQDASP